MSIVKNGNPEFTVSDRGCEFTVTRDGMILGRDCELAYETFEDLYTSAWNVLESYLEHLILKGN